MYIVEKNCNFFRGGGIKSLKNSEKRPRAASHAEIRKIKNQSQNQMGKSKADIMVCKPKFNAAQFIVLFFVLGSARYKTVGLCLGSIISLRVKSIGFLKSLLQKNKTDSYAKRRLFERFKRVVVGN